MVWCVDDGDIGAAVSACGDDETLEIYGFDSNHAVFFVDGAGFVPCEGVPALAEPAADKASAATTLQQILEEQRLQTCIQFKACGQACAGMAPPYGC